ncbi:MAG: FAD:protein FMN transferase [Planctomycetaceae bacterium]
MRTALVIGLLAGTSLVQSEASAKKADRFSYTELHMGVPFRITVYGSDKVAANTAVAKAYKRIATLNQVFSDYESTSEVSRLRKLPAKEATTVSQDMASLIHRSLAVSRATDGAFDVTCGPLVRQWRRARRRKRLPEPELLQKALKQSGYQRIRLTNRELVFEETGMRLDFGAIAKGYACDEALRILREAGFRSALVDGGGDIVVGNPPPGKTAWRVQIEPDAKDKASGLILQLANQAVATSGDRYRFVEIDGVRYSHIVDPMTGTGLTSRLTVTVVAPNATDADAFASAVSVLGSKRGTEFIHSKPNAECLIRDYSKSDIRTTTSRGFAELEKLKER